MPFESAIHSNFNPKVYGCLFKYSFYHWINVYPKYHEKDPIESVWNRQVRIKTVSKPIYKKKITAIKWGDYGKNVEKKNWKDKIC